MKYYKEKSKIENGANTSEVGLNFQGDIIVGKFIERERPTFLENMNARFSEVFGDSFVTYEG